MQLIKAMAQYDECFHWDLGVQILLSNIWISFLRNNGDLEENWTNEKRFSSQTVSLKPNRLGLTKILFRQTTSTSKKWKETKKKETKKQRNKENRQRVWSPTRSGYILNNKQTENYRKLHKITGKKLKKVTVMEGGFCWSCSMRGTHTPES